MIDRLSVVIALVCIGLFVAERNWLAAMWALSYAMNTARLIKMEKADA